jgi:hypothetical protein
MGSINRRSSDNQLEDCVKLRCQTVVAKFSRGPFLGAGGKLGCGVVAKKVKLVVDPDLSSVFANLLVKTHAPMAGLIVWVHALFATATPHKLTAEQAITAECSHIAAMTTAPVGTPGRPCNRRPFSKLTSRQGLMNHCFGRSLSSTG